MMAHLGSHMLMYGETYYLQSNLLESTTETNIKFNEYEYLLLKNLIAVFFQQEHISNCAQNDLEILM